MELSQFEALLTTVSFLTLYILIFVLAIHFIFRKNILVRNYIFLVLVALVVLVSYYNTIFKNADNWIQSVLSTVVFIGLVRQQLIYKKKIKQ